LWVSFIWCLMYSRSILLNTHQWYWSYRECHEFLVSSGEFIEFDSYIVPDSDLDTPKVAIAEFNLIVVLDKVGIGNIMEDETLRRIIEQVELKHKYPAKSVYSTGFPETCQLNTPELRSDFADRIAASGDLNFKTEMVTHGDNIGEYRVQYSGCGRVVRPTSKLVDLLKANP